MESSSMGILENEALSSRTAHGSAERLGAKWSAGLKRGGS